MCHIRIILSAFCICLLSISIIGCSSNSPVISNESNSELSEIPVLGLVDTGDSFNSIGLLGEYELQINPVEQSADLIAKRISSIGEDFIVGGIGFFTISPCSTCLKIKSISMDLNNNIVVTFSIKHPFDPGDPLKPPSAINRLDLDVFDLALLVKPTEETPAIFPLFGIDAYTGYSVDPDGYTIELGPALNDPSAIPYFLVIDDSDTGIGTFNEFAMGAESNFDITLDLSLGALNFNLYLTMGYGASAKKNQRLEPKYYNPEFNRKPAWKVNVIPPQGTNPPAIGNTWNNEDNATPFDVTIEVYDWQHTATVWDGVTPPTFDEADPDNVFAASQIGYITVEIPGMNSTLQIISSATSGTGTPDDPLIWVIPIVNEYSLPVGEYVSLVKVSDTRSPAIIWELEGRDYLIDSPDGIILQSYNIPEYATYQAFIATVVYGCGPITGEVLSPACPVTGIGNTETVDFTVTATSDNGGGNVILYEIDYDYDGITFDVDDSNTDGIFTDAGPFLNPNCPADPVPPVTYTVAFRGTDECSPPNNMVFASCDVTVDTCNIPVGNLKIEVNYLAHVYMDQGYYKGYKNPIDINNPWTLSWDATVGAVSYAIYYDDDPSDGLTNDLQFVDETTSLIYDPPASHCVSNHLVIGTTYTVRARTTLGDPTSELPNSEPAFVMVNSWETLPSPAIPGAGNDGEGWLAGNESNWYGDYNRFPCVYFTQACHGSRTCRPYGPWTGREGINNPGHWSGITKETPVVPDSSVRFIGFNGSTWVGWSGAETSPRYGGIIIGTCSTHPGINWTDPTEFEWAQAADHGDFTPYVDEVDYVETIFDDVATSGNNCWNWYNWGTDPWIAPDPESVNDHLFGGDVNNGGNPDDPYIGIVACRSQIQNATYFYIDDVSVCIY